MSTARRGQAVNEASSVGTVSTWNWNSAIQVAQLKPLFFVGEQAQGPISSKTAREAGNLDLYCEIS